MTRDNPQTTPKKDDFRLQCAGAKELDHLQTPTHTRRAPFSGCHGEGKERLKTLSFKIAFILIDGEYEEELQGLRGHE